MGGQERRVSVGRRTYGEEVAKKGNPAYLTTEIEQGGWGCGRPLHRIESVEESGGETKKKKEKPGEKLRPVGREQSYRTGIGLLEGGRSSTRCGGALG